MERNIPIQSLVLQTVISKELVKNNISVQGVFPIRLVDVHTSKNRMSYSALLFSQGILIAWYTKEDKKFRAKIADKAKVTILNNARSFFYWLQSYAE